MFGFLSSILSLTLVFLVIFGCFDLARFIRSFIKKKFNNLFKKEDFAEIKKNHKNIPVEMVEVDEHEKAGSE